MFSSLPQCATASQQSQQPVRHVFSLIQVKLHRDLHRSTSHQHIRGFTTRCYINQLFTYLLLHTVNNHPHETANTQCKLDIQQQGSCNQLLQALNHTEPCFKLH